jgi:polar amino acid transport system substrate-binding protein
MKKCLALTLALILALGCTACSSSSSSSQETTTESGTEDTNYSSTDVEYHSVAEIQKRGVIRIATEATFAPYAFLDSDGNIVGLEASLVQAIADDLGVECVIDNMAFDSVLPSVQSGLDDIAFAALTPTAERQEAFTFTISYLSNGQMSLVRAEDADKFADESSMVAGVTMGAQKGSYQQTVAETLYPECTGRYMETVPNVVMDLKAGNIDIAIMDYDNAYSYAAQNDDLVTAFKVPMLEGDEESNCAAAMLGNTDLTSAINELIQKYIDDGSMQKWYEEAVELQLSLNE